MLAASSNAHAVARRERRSGNLAEVLVWRELRKRPGGYKFRRQHPLSEIVLDFVCLSARLVVEIDGEAHNRGDRPARDERRDALLRQQGFTVLRLPATDILDDLDAAIATIAAACEAATPPPPLRGGPPPRAGEVLMSHGEKPC